MTYLIRDMNDCFVAGDEHPDTGAMTFEDQDVACQVAKQLSRETGRTHTVVKVVDVAIYPGSRFVDVGDE